MGAYMKSLFKIIAVSAIALSPVPALAQNLLVNGGFEDSTGPYQYGSFTHTGTATGGNITSIITYGPGAAYPNGAYGNPVAPPYGQANNFKGAYFAADSGTETLSQQISIVAGQDYEFKFDGLFPANGYANVGNAVFQVTFTDSGNFTHNLVTVPVNASLAADTWKDWSSFFNTTQSGLGTLSLTFVPDGQVGKDIVIDNLSVAAVPEASTWAMMIMGVGAVGAGMRRRNKLGMGSAKLANA